jgi:ATP-dependent exoDNAse (exonuclease V) alpha subunit
VHDVDGDRIHLEDGRTLPANYHEFDHGYAVTAHRSQGKTVDAVILSADAMKQELFYVGASRAARKLSWLLVTANNCAICSASPRRGHRQLSWQENRRSFIQRQCLTPSGHYRRPLNRRCCGKRMTIGTIWE